MTPDTFVNPSVAPVPNRDTTRAVGIFPSDLILRTALLAGLSDMRRQPWVLDYVFAHLPQDALTAERYGTQEARRVREWFEAEEIVVTAGIRPPDGAPKKNHVTVEVMSSDEVENTLGDVDPFPHEDAEAIDPSLTPPFNPVSYDAAAGRMVLPSSVTDALTVSTAMSVTDDRGQAYPIIEVESGDTVLIAEGTVAPFQNCRLRPTGAPYVVSLEGATFRENYIVGCYAHGEPVHLTYLHSVVLFVLLRYRQIFLEARGLERTQVTSKEIMVKDLSPVEGFHGRLITLTGIVRHVWPKVSSRILSATTQTTPDGLDVEETTDLDVDSLSGKIEV